MRNTRTLDIDEIKENSKGMELRYTLKGWQIFEFTKYGDINLVRHLSELIKFLQTLEILVPYSQNDIIKLFNNFYCAKQKSRLDIHKDSIKRYVLFWQKVCENNSIFGVDIVRKEQKKIPFWILLYYPTINDKYQKSINDFVKKDKYQSMIKFYKNRLDNMLGVLCNGTD